MFFPLLTRVPFLSFSEASLSSHPSNCLMLYHRYINYEKVDITIEMSDLNLHYAILTNEILSNRELIKDQTQYYFLLSTNSLDTWLDVTCAYFQGFGIFGCSDDYNYILLSQHCESQFLKQTSRCTAY